MSQKTKRLKQKRKQMDDRKLPNAFKDAPNDIVLASGEVCAIEAAEGQVPSFSGVAYTGGKMTPSNLRIPVVVDLQGMSKANSIPALRDHDLRAVVGHWDNVDIGAENIRASGVASGQGSDAGEEVIRASQSGFSWQLSIGARIQAREYVPEGKSVVVNNQTHEGPFLLATQTRLSEISFTAIGADDATEVAIAASEGEEEFELADAVSVVANALGCSEEDVLNLTAAHNEGANEQEDVMSQNKEQQDIQATADEMFAEAAKARQHIQRINEICAAAGDPTIEVSGTLVDLAAHALEQKWDETKVELEALRAARPSHNQMPDISTGVDGSPESALCIEASLAMRVGVKAETIAADYGQDVVNEAQSKKYRGFRSLHAVMHECIRAAGMYHQPGMADNEFIRKAFEASKKLEATGFTTHSITTALANIANKMMLQAYNAISTTWQNFCSVADHNNFHTHTKFRMTGDGQFLPLGQDGEIKHGRMSDDSYTNRVQTQARMFACTREDLINDELGALGQIPRTLGRGAAVGQEKMFWTLVLANPNNFFHANNGNLMTRALSIQGLSEAEQLFINQVDKYGNPIGINPDRIAVGAPLKTLANQLYNDTTVNRESDLAMQSNPYAGTYMPTVTPYLNNTAIKDGTHKRKSIPNQSDSVWMMAADPDSGVAAFEMAFLQGNRTPMIESADADFRQLGIEFRGYWDIGVAQQDPKGAVWSSGTVAPS